MKDHDTEAQIWYKTIGRKFISCSLACFLSAFSFLFYFAVLNFFFFHFQDLISNSPFCVSYNCYDDLNENDEFTWKKMLFI